MIWISTGDGGFWHDPEAGRTPWKSEEPLDGRVENFDASKYLTREEVMAQSVLKGQKR